MGNACNGNTSENIKLKILEDKLRKELAPKDLTILPKSEEALLDDTLLYIYVGNELKNITLGELKTVLPISEGGQCEIIIDPETHNWIVNGVQTNISATGPQGPEGKPGQDGKDGINGKDGLPGKDGVDGAQGEKGEQGLRGAAGQDGKNGIIPHIGVNGNWWLDDKDTGCPARGPKGDRGCTGTKGEKGDKGDPGIAGTPGKAGRGIIKINLESSINGIDTYKIYYTDKTFFSFQIKNGITPKITVGTNGNWYIDDKDTGHAAQGPQGPRGLVGLQGSKGDTGNGIIDIEKVGSEGYKDIYRINFTDGTSSRFVVTNGMMVLGETADSAYAGDKGKKNADDIKALGESMDVKLTSKANLIGDKLNAKEIPAYLPKIKYIDKSSSMSTIHTSPIWRQQIYLLGQIDTDKNVFTFKKTQINPNTNEDIRYIRGWVIFVDCTTRLQYVYDTETSKYVKVTSADKLGVGDEFTFLKDAPNQFKEDRIFIRETGWWNDQSRLENDLFDCAKASSNIMELIDSRNWIKVNINTYETASSQNKLIVTEYQDNALSSYKTTMVQKDKITTQDQKYTNGNMTGSTNIFASGDIIQGTFKRAADARTVEWTGQTNMYIIPEKDNDGKWYQVVKLGSSGITKAGLTPNLKVNLYTPSEQADKQDMSTCILTSDDLDKTKSVLTVDKVRVSQVPVESTDVVRKVELDDKASIELLDTKASIELLGAFSINSTNIADSDSDSLTFNEALAAQVSKIFDKLKTLNYINPFLNIKLADLTEMIPVNYLTGSLRLPIIENIQFVNVRSAGVVGIETYSLTRSALTTSEASILQAIPQVGLDVEVYAFKK